jgi:hypothetical protein
MRLNHAMTYGTLLASTMLVTGLASAPAQARPPDEPPCYAHSCYGKPPTISRNGLSCGDDVSTPTKVAVPTMSANIELRFSANCQANWARINPMLEGVSFWVQNEYGEKQAAYSDNSQYTAMVDGTPKAWVCVHYAAVEQCSDHA